MFIKYIFSLLVGVSLFFASVNVAEANSILSTSVRKTATDGLNFTFYTQNDSVDVPIVKDKGNNQYVILLPDLSDNSGRQPDLRAVSEIVSDFNIKTVSEGAVTYTKVSLTTKIPVNISVDTRKTSQSTKDLAGVNDVIAKVNLIKSDIQSSNNIQTASIQQPVVKNVSSIKDILNNKDSIGQVQSAVQVEKVEVKKENLAKPVVKNVVPVNSLSAHIPTNTKSIKKETKKLQDENIKNVRNESVKNINKIEKNIKSSVENNVSINKEESPLESDIESIDLTPLPSLQEKELVDLQPKVSLLNSPKVIILFVSLIILLALLFVVNRVRVSISNDDIFGGAFIERMNMSIGKDKKDYSQIAENKNLSWQEKYNSFKSGEIQEQKKIVDDYVGVDVDDDLDVVDENVDDIEFVNDEVASSEEEYNPFAVSDGELLARGLIVDSGDVISGSLRRTLKGFSADKSLSKTKRNVGLKNRFSSFEMGDATVLERNIHELLDTVIKLDEDKSEVVEPVIDENVDKTIETIKEVSSVVNNSSSPIQAVEKPVQLQNRKLKIKESRAIDDNRGFYLVDMQDKLALMGRINDKFTVLKKFDDLNMNSLHVRRDKDNLYMVRTEGFKALVDVNENKMGVLAEL